MSQTREISPQTRDAIMATLVDMGEEWISAREILDGLTSIETITYRQMGGVLRRMRELGQVENKAVGDANVWRIKQGNGAEPAHPNGYQTRKIARPADNHPWKEKVYRASEPRPQAISCELPAHLLTPQPTSEAVIEPAAGTGDFLIANPPFSTQDEIKALEDHMRAEGSLPAESHEDEAPSVTYPAYPPLSQFYRDQIQAKETDIRNEPTEHHGCNGHCRKTGRVPAKPVTTTQTRQLPRLPKDYTARIKVGIYADSDNAFLTIIAEDEGSGAFWTLETKGGRLSFDQGEADWLPQLGDGLAQLLDTLNGHLINQPET